MAGCSSDDTLNGSTVSSGNAAVTGELATFDVQTDRTTAEPASAAAEYFPVEEDMLENNEFTTEVAIDLSNPVGKTENGVEVTVENGHIKANHGETKKVYLSSG